MVLVVVTVLHVWAHNGEIRPLEPGTMLLAEDTTAKWVTSPA
jgi:hypothetical protein